MGPVTPKRGLKQGDPLFPYLFLICSEGPNALLHKVVEAEELHSIKISRDAPTISQLLFADDNFLFSIANMNEVAIIHDILSTYEVASGQAVNLHKSDFFFQ